VLMRRRRCTIPDALSRSATTRTISYDHKDRLVAHGIQRGLHRSGVRMKGRARQVVCRGIIGGPLIGWWSAAPAG
jgi:hypothetical protein